MNDCSLLNRLYLFKQLSRVISVATLLGFTHCWALTAQTIPLKDLVESSDLVVYASVQSQEVKALYPNRPQMLFTLSTLKVEECWKGACGNEVVVSQVGGQKGSLAVSLPGAPLLKVKSQVILFLKRKVKVKLDEIQYVIVGLNQGVYEIKTQDNQLWVTHPHAPSSVHSSTEKEVHPKPTDDFKSILFEQFKVKILASIRSVQVPSVEPQILNPQASPISGADSPSHSPRP